jgi:copper chaperone CopZ
MSVSPSDPAGTVSISLTVSGMHCPSCPALIEDALGDQRGVSHVSVGFDAAEALVVYRPSTVTVDELCAVIESAGYKASPREDRSCP